METAYKITSGGIVLRSFDEIFSAVILKPGRFDLQPFSWFPWSLRLLSLFCFTFHWTVRMGAKQSENCYFLLYIHLNSIGARENNTVAT